MRTTDPSPVSFSVSFSASESVLSAGRGDTEWGPEVVAADGTAGAPAAVKANSSGRAVAAESGRGSGGAGASAMASGECCRNPVIDAAPAVVAGKIVTTEGGCGAEPMGKRGAPAIDNKEEARAIEDEEEAVASDPGGCRLPETPARRKRDPEEATATWVAAGAAAPALLGAARAAAVAGAGAGKAFSLQIP